MKKKKTGEEPVVFITMKGGGHLGFHWEKSVKDHFNKKLSYQNN